MSAEAWLLIGIALYALVAFAIHVKRMRETYRQGYTDGVRDERDAWTAEPEGSDT